MWGRYNLTRIYGSRTTPLVPPQVHPSPSHPFFLHLVADVLVPRWVPTAMAPHVVLDPDATPGVSSKVMDFSHGIFRKSNSINQLKNDLPKILARIWVNFKKKRNISLFWTWQEVARKCKMSKCSSSGQKKMVFISFSFWTIAFFFHEF